MSDQGRTYFAFIENELKAERDRRAANDARGQAVVTTSAALVTFLVALATLVRATTPVAFPRAAVAPLILALVSLAGASALGILASWNFKYFTASSGTLRIMVSAHWKDHEVDARNAVAMAEIFMVESLRKASHRKARLVGRALLAQLSALIWLGVVILLIAVE